MLATLSAATIGSSIASADDDTDKNTTTSNASVQFKEGDKPGPTPPGPTPPNPSPDGPLTIDAVSNFNFGTDNELQSAAKSYKLVVDADNDFHNGDAADDTNLQPLVQVTDHRDGVPTGWKLTVSGTALSSKDVADITGATITVNSADVKAAENTDSNDNEAVANKGYAIDLNGSGTAQEVMSADAGKGMGTWRDWLGTDTTLDMPANNHATKDVAYQSTLTWTIEATPAV